MILACALSFLAGGVVVAVFAKALRIVEIRTYYTPAELKSERKA